MNGIIESSLTLGALVGHAGYILLILSMLMTRMLWLRIIAIAAGILQAIYYGVFLHDPVGTFWETIFTLTNAGQLALLIAGARLARFNAEERAFYETAVPTLEPGDARRLIKAGRFVDAPAGTVLAKEGEVVETLAFLVSGDVAVTVAGNPVADIGPGSFIGEISVSTGGPATATATTKTAVRYLAFERPVIAKFLDNSAEIGRAIELAFRLGLRDKLIRTNAAMAAAMTASRPMP
jgi:hypothetical protein